MLSWVSVIESITRLRVSVPKVKVKSTLFVRVYVRVSMPNDWQLPEVSSNISSFKVPSVLNNKFVFFSQDVVVPGVLDS